MVDLASLPADVQAKVRAQLGEKVKRKKDRSVAGGPGLPLSCTTCQEVVAPTDGAIAAHRKRTGHGRLEWRP